MLQLGQHFSISELFNGTAETIEGELVPFLDNKPLSINNMVIFGSDGASVMKNWSCYTAKKQAACSPCAAHRLALADAGENVHYIRHTFKPSLAELLRIVVLGWPV